MPYKTWISRLYGDLHRTQIEIKNERNFVLSKKVSWMEDDEWVAGNPTSRFNLLYNRAMEICDRMEQMRAVDKYQ